MTNQQKLNGIQHFLKLIPHCKKLSMQAEAVTEEGVLFSMPAEAPLLGNLQAGLIHGGALTVLMDTACGSAAILGLPKPEVCPTVDLRLDHYRPAVVGQRLFCRAWFTQVTAQIVFTEGVIWQEEVRPLAKGTGTFMRLGSERTPPGFAEQLFGWTDHE